eukprot:GHVR01024394.1.p1 GENE.GHVR01024394.1~~GHVR01024394.1.p1  ORF type:complete len:116 (+),score=11.70 GHVR01024394.1:36-383(+)
MNTAGEPGIKACLIPKKNKKAIYQYLFREGVIVVKKDATLPLHKGVEVSNLHVIMTMKSLKSRNYVLEKFCWRHHYYFLTSEGIEYLREVLHLPPNIFPQTFQKPKAGPKKRNDE